MVNIRTLFIWIASTVALVGCSNDKIGYDQACKLFHTGMSPVEVEKMYGEPEFKNQLGDFVLWEYPPTERIKVPAKDVEEFRGFQIEFRDNRTTKIAPIWSVEKHHPKEGHVPENGHSP